MRTILRVSAVFLMLLICRPLTEAVAPSPTASPFHRPSATNTPTVTPTATATATPTPTEPPHFASGFDEELILEETDRMDRSASTDWWVNSGGWFLQRGGVGSTWIGEAPDPSRWRDLYNLSNPADSDRGAHPQNLFRLITRSRWLSPEQQVYCRILADNLSAGGNRNASNGILLFSRYADEENLYYAGIRVDGSAVIKKKSGGAYTTLAEAALYPGTYHRTREPNLIPHNQWIGLRTVILRAEDSVFIQLYYDPDRSGFWVLILQAEDSMAPSAAPAQAEYAGIRTDFMDVEFDDYRIREWTTD